MDAALAPFRDYASPFPHLMYSSSFFHGLAISEAIELSYPSIAPVGSVFSAVFSDEVPRSAAATVMMPGEVIPHYSDLRTITADLEDEYKRGRRSVAVEFKYMGAEYSFVYHFSKVCQCCVVLLIEPL